MNLKKKISFLNGDKLVLTLAIVFVFVLFNSLNHNFFSWTNIINILVASSLVGLVAIGHTYLIIAGQNDLSSGSVAAIAGVISALLASAGLNFFLVVLITLLVCALIGAFNAFMVNRIKLESFIATLVTQSIIRGFAYILSGGIAVAISDPTFLALGRIRIIGIPLSVWITVLLIIIFGFILKKTKFGRSVYAIGGSEDAARLAGLNPNKIKAVSYILMGVLCAIGGIIFASRMNSGQPASAVNLEFDSITAVVLGGVSFSGGVGSMTGTALGIILIQSFNTGLTMVNVPTFWHYVARGGLLLFALTSDFIRKRKRERELLEESIKNL